MVDGYCLLSPRAVRPRLGHHPLARRIASHALVKVNETVKIDEHENGSEGATQAWSELNAPGSRTPQPKVKSYASTPGDAVRTSRPVCSDWPATRVYRRGMPLTSIVARALPASVRERVPLPPSTR